MSDLAPTPEKKEISRNVIAVIYHIQDGQQFVLVEKRHPVEGQPDANLNKLSGGGVEDRETGRNPRVALIRELLEEMSSESFIKLCVANQKHFMANESSDGKRVYLDQLLVRFCRSYSQEYPDLLNTFHTFLDKSQPESSRALALVKLKSFRPYMSNGQSSLSILARIVFLSGELDLSSHNRVDFFTDCNKTFKSVNRISDVYYIQMPEMLNLHPNAQEDIENYEWIAVSELNGNMRFPSYQKALDGLSEKLNAGK